MTGLGVSGLMDFFTAMVDSGTMKQPAVRFLVAMEVPDAIWQEFAAALTDYERAGERFATAQDALEASMTEITG